MKNEESNQELNDDFERRLEGLPLREIPSEWRNEILSAARSRSSALDPRPGSRLAILSRQFTALMSPHPRAWAALASVWVVILALNFAAHDSEPRTAHRNAPPSSDTLQALRQQERLLAELIGPPESRNADRPKVVLPRPRSQRRDDILAA